MEDNTFVVHGPESLVPLPEETVGKIVFDRLILRNPDEIALEDAVSKETITYGRILEQACYLADALRRFGCDNDSVISVISENTLEFFIPVLASLFAGTTLAPLNQFYQENELEHALGITKPKIIFVSQLVAPKILKLCSTKLKFVQRMIIYNSSKFHQFNSISIQGAQTLVEFLDEHLQGNRIPPNSFVPFNKNSGTHVAWILCSSGTTGLPKGVMLTHKNILVRTVSSWDHRYKINSPVLGLMPFFHSYGINTGLNSIINGHLLIVLKGFDEDTFLKTIQDYKIASLTFAPPLVVFLTKTPKLEKYDLSSVQEIYCGAAPLNEKIEKAVKKRLNIKHFYQGYGLTETNQAVILMQKNQSRPGSVGKAIIFSSIKIRDTETGKSLGPNQVGEICVGGPSVMKGYYNNEEATRQSFTSDGWLRTGDLGYYDEDKYFYIVDRLKELIKYKGYQVAPAELEAILLTHPEVIDVGVIGMPDELAGELPAAFVVAKTESVTEKELQDFIANKVSPQKRLRGGVIFVNEIPKNASGKILKKELRQKLMSTKRLQSKL